MTTAKQEPPAQALSAIRDRIKEFRRVPADEIKLNPRNWRLHPYAQRKAIAESLERIGMADALLAYYSQRDNGALTLINGHARLEELPDDEWPVLILDVDDDEADLLLTTLDPMTYMAESDEGLLSELLDDIGSVGTPALEDLLRSLGAEISPLVEEIVAEVNPVPEMELQAFEHYDYIVLLFRNSLDWQRAKDLFQIQEEAFTLRDGQTRKVGLGRVVDGKRAIELLVDLPAPAPREDEAELLTDDLSV